MVLLVEFVQVMGLEYVLVRFFRLLVVLVACPSLTGTAPTVVEVFYVVPIPRNSRKCGGACSQVVME